MPALDAVAHTVVYDCLISEATGTELLWKVSTPTLVLPDARHRSLRGGWHGVAVEDVAPVVTEFCRAG